MQPLHARTWIRLELLATTAGVTMAGAGLLALMLCASGLRGVHTLFTDWALLAGALAPSSHATWRRLAPLFWTTRPAHDAPVSKR